MSEAKPIEPSEKKRGCSPWVWGCLGCGGVLMIALVVVGIATTMWVQGILADANEYAAEFEAKGYKKVSGQALVESGDIEGPRVYLGQMVNLKGDVEGDLAFAAQLVEIEGTVNGNIDFYGQLLHVKPGAVIKGDIKVKQAQVVKIEGTVEGQVTGSYMVLEGKDRIGTSAEPEAISEDQPTDAKDAGETSDTEEEVSTSEAKADPE